MYYILFIRLWLKYIVLSLLLFFFGILIIRHYEIIYLTFHYSIDFFLIIKFIYFIFIYSIYYLSPLIIFFSILLTYYSFKGKNIPERMALSGVDNLPVIIKLIILLVIINITVYLIKPSAKQNIKSIR